MHFGDDSAAPMRPRGFEPEASSPVLVKRRPASPISNDALSRRDRLAWHAGRGAGAEELAKCAIRMAGSIITYFGRVPLDVAADEADGGRKP